MTTRPVLDRIARGLGDGRLEWIGLRPARKADMLQVGSAEAAAGRGLAGDRRMDATPGSARQVTLVNAEHLEVIGRLLGREAIAPELLRRNLVVSGINLLALRHQCFRIGAVRFRGTALCHPCSRMDANLGPGGHAAVLGHGGICATVETGGPIRVGDVVSVEVMGAAGESVR